MDIVFAGVGLILLVLAGDVLVRGAVAISLRLGIPALIVSLTIVAFGTSAPELLISVKSALEGAPGLALGNVLGSNIANVFLVLGVPALISGIDGRQSDTRQSYQQMLGATFIFIGLLYAGPLHIWHGVVLLVLLIGMIGRAVWQARAARIATVPDDVEDDGMPAWRAVVYLLAGIIGLPIGADLLVDAARNLATDWGVSDEVIGLTLVAIGTSLPELATTVMAAIRRQADVALGNVIGSNLLNILAIMGITSFFGPLAVPPHLLQFDIWVMLAAAFALLPFVWFKMVMGRAIGIGFLLIYGTYIYVLF